MCCGFEISESENIKIPGCYSISTQHSVSVGVRGLGRLGRIREKEGSELKRKCIVDQ